MAHLGSEDVRMLVRLLPESLYTTVSHLLICQDCRYLAASVILHAEPPAEPAPLTCGLVESLAGLADHRDRFEAAARRDEETAEARFGEWLAHPARAEAALAEPRFQTPGLVRRILSLAELLAETSPSETELLTHVALETLARIDGNRFAAGDLVQLEILACCLQSKAWRACGRTRSARAVLQSVAPSVQTLPLDSSMRALYGLELGLVRRDQDRLDEAAALLERAAKSLLLKGMYASAGQAHLEIGWTCLRAREVQAARQSFTLALTLLGQEPLSAVLRARQGLATALALAGRRDEARESWSEVRELLAALPEGPRWRARAWEAELEMVCRAPRRAERLLAPCIDAFLNQGMHADAAHSALRLGLMFWRRKRTRDLEGLAGRILPQLAEDRLFPRSRRVTAFAFGLALEGEPRAGAVLDLAARYLRYGRHNPNLPFYPCETVDGLLVWDGLGEERRRAFCDEAGLAPETAGQPAASLPQDIQDRIAWGHELRAGVRILFDDPEGDVLKPTEERNHHAITQPSWQHP